MLKFCVEFIVAYDSCAEKCCVCVKSRNTKEQDVVQNVARIKCRNPLDDRVPVWMMQVVYQSDVGM